MKHPSHGGTDNIVEPRPGTALPEIQTALVRIEPTAEGNGGNSQPLTQPDESPIVIDEGFAVVTQAEALKLALSAPQRAAIELLTSGHTLVAAATAAGVSRMTLYRWLKGDAAFSAAFNAWQQDVLDTARGRVLALSDLAVTTIAKSMSRGDAKTALKVLQSIGALDRRKVGSTDPEEIERQQNLEWKKAKTAAKKAETDAMVDEMLA